MPYGGETFRAHEYALTDGSLPERSVRLIRVLEAVIAPIADGIPKQPPDEPPGRSDVEYDARVVVDGCSGGTPAVEDAVARLNALLRGGIAPAEEEEARRHVNTVLNEC